MSSVEFQRSRSNAPSNDPMGTVNVLQGEFAMSGSETCSLNTVLGSCVSVCFHDPVLKIGGMNHILLPEGPAADVNQVIFGLHSMEVLINALLRRGASRQSLQAKLFGGASMISGLSNIGQRNIEFARKFLADEGYRLLAEDTGGARGRRLRFWPATGRVQMRYMIDEDPLPDTQKFAKPKLQNDVELF